MTAVGPLVSANVTWRGRLSRKGFWISVALFYLFSLLTVPLQAAVMVVQGQGSLGRVLGLSSMAFAAALGWFLLGAVVRRLHDRGRPAWWLLVFFGPFVSALIVLSRFPISDNQLMVLAIAGLGVFTGPFLVWGMVEIAAVRGRKGANRFGDDPLEIEVEAEAAP